MTLEEIFAADDEYPIPADLPEIELELTEAELLAAGNRLDESRWTPSHIHGIYQRIDPARPEMKQRRHVHLSTKKYLTTPDKQVAWNDDGTRHDRHNFNDRFGKQPSVRDVARVALGLSDDVILEHRTAAGLLIERVAQSRVLESIADHTQTPERVRLISQAAKAA